MFLLKNGASLDPGSKSFNPDDLHHIRKRTCRLRLYDKTPNNGNIVLTPYLPRPKIRKQKNLLGNAEDATGEEEEVCTLSLEPSSFLQANNRRKMSSCHIGIAYVEFSRGMGFILFTSPSRTSLWHWCLTAIHWHTPLCHLPFRTVSNNTISFVLY